MSTYLPSSTGTPSSSPAGQAEQPSTQESNAALAAMGAVSAPYQGPQPAAVVVAFEQEAALQGQVDVSHDNTSTFAAFPSIASSVFAQGNLISAPVLRSTSHGNMIAPRPHRPMHFWSHSQGSHHLESLLSSKVSLKTSKSTKKANSRLLFDIADGTKGKEAETDHFEVLFSPPGQVHPDRWSNRGFSSDTNTVSSSSASARMRLGTIVTDAGSLPLSNSTFAEQEATSSRSPSPKSSNWDPDRELGPKGLLHNVREPPRKFAVTTSSESGMSTDGASSATKPNASVTASSSASASGSSVSHNAAPQTGQTDRWARHFNIPRSAKRHDYMFEHGAYGIPKRHPLSSIRNTPLPSASGRKHAERPSPSHDMVPSSKIQAAQDMLNAAADFLAGPQVPQTKHNEYRPTNGQDALRAAYSGGSTADGRELRRSSSASRKGKERPASVHRMAIRGDDGRIIKDRLRSVQVGEDSYFLRPDSLGVADGVGGWASRPGADPALFSRLLMHFCAVELSRYDGLSASELAADDGSMLKAWASVDPVEVMHRAWERCVRASRREGILGSSTALLAVLRGDELRIANVGDCVLMIVRGGDMVFRSTEQQHSFNFPVQLGMMGDTSDTLRRHAQGAQREKAAREGEVTGGALEDYDDVEDEHSAEHRDVHALAPGVSHATQASDGNEPEWDEPRRDAGRWTVRVEAGDIIVVGSDGLMDNLFDEDIMEEVLRFLPKDAKGQPDQQSLRHEGGLLGKISSAFSPQLVSEALCSRAKAVSEDSRAISSPFQQRAIEEGLVS